MKGLEEIKNTTNQNRILLSQIIYVFFIGIYLWNNIYFIYSINIKIFYLFIQDIMIEHSEHISY